MTIPRLIETIRVVLALGPDASESAYSEAEEALDALAAELAATKEETQRIRAAAVRLGRDHLRVATEAEAAAKERDHWRLLALKEQMVAEALAAAGAGEET